MAIGGGDAQGGESVIVLMIQIGPTVQQERCNLQMAIGGGDAQGGESVIVLTIYVDALVDQRRNQCQVSISCCLMEVQKLRKILYHVVLG
jgi:hypothetical protein